MQTSSMQRLSQFFSSSLLILFGMAVVTASLQSLHAKQTFASQGDFSSLPEASGAGHRLAQLIDRDLPGSLPYTFARGLDRITLLFDEPQDQLPRLLEFSRNRAESALLASDEGREVEALVTFSKAVAYYHRALAACRENPDCSQYEKEFRDTKIVLLDASGTLLDESSNGEIRAKFQGLSGELETLSDPAF